MNNIEETLTKLVEHSKKETQRRTNNFLQLQIDRLLFDNKQKENEINKLKERITRQEKQQEVIVKYLINVMVRVEQLQQEDFLLPDLEEVLEGLL